MSDSPFKNMQDRRILKTNDAITGAFLTLISEKDFSEIIVKDITVRANVNRSTFYTHYQDKYDLRDKVMKEKLDCLASMTPVFQEQHDFETADLFFTALFEHIAANESFYKVMLLQTEKGGFRDKMTEVVRDLCYKRIIAIHMEKKLHVPLDILLDYLSGSIMGIITKWIEQEMIYTPRHMALQLTRISSLGTYKAMGM
ncbi:TetR/AcrR family transcriptional regulator [Paenibacillaceae bacterium]|nr:TetR/AcrR family transcriptional regulator [Paenibacillaceae bacterium]